MKTLNDKNYLLELKHELLKIEAQKGRFISFCKLIKTDYNPSWHHEILAKELQNFLIDKTCKKLMVFMPPQHGKSELTSRLFPAYALGVNPNLKIALCSYSSDLANAFNRDIQRNIDNETYKTIFPKVKINSKNVITTQSWLRNSEIFEIVDHKGYLKSVGVGGGLTGRSVDLGIIDDPIKDQQEANSETIRENIWQWYLNVFMTRLHNDSKQLIIMTRWHEDDLCGRILNPEINPKSNEWKVVQFEAIKESDVNYEDPRQIGQPLWPERHNLESLLAKKALDSDRFDSLYQQNPYSKTGNKIGASSFQFSQLPISHDRIDVWIDGAYTDKTKNDPTGLLAVKYIQKINTLYVLDFTTKRLELPELLDYLPQYFKSVGITQGSCIYIEPKASGKSIKQMINKTHSQYPIIEITNNLVNEGKEARFQVATPYIQSGKIQFVNVPNIQELIKQFCGYPKVKHDEAIDLLGYAANHYFKPLSSNFGMIGLDNLH